eukprot:scaffold200057_cov19-Tisochrysis_lutea.AAC.2
MDSRSSFCALSPLVLQGMPVGLHPPPQGLSVDLLNAVPYSVPDGLRRESGTVVIKGMQNCIIVILKSLFFLWLACRESGSGMKKGRWSSMLGGMQRACRALCGFDSSWAKCLAKNTCSC